ncbi:MAG: hypothetical protein HYU29_03840 [Chloroflexi bacterium]|nr:hypothetical protein [Chloroflexota bacterium]
MTVSLDGPSLSLLSAKGNSILSWLTMPFNPRLLSAAGVQDPKGLSSVISSAVQRMGKAPRTVLVAYAGRLTSRLMALPPVKGVNPDILVPREARRLMGTAADYQHLFWAPVEAASGTTQYLLLAAPRTDLNNFVQSLLLAGLRPKRVEARPLALARAVGSPDAIIINLGQDQMEVLVLARHIPFVTAQRALRLGLSAEDLVSEIVDEVQRALAFYNERNPGATLPASTPLYLSGRHHLVREGGHQLLQTALQRPVQPPGPHIISYPADFPVSEYLVNVGLALRS